MKRTRHGRYIENNYKSKHIKAVGSQEYKRFCRYSKALAQVESVLLELSYEIYKDQDYAEKICASRGWGVKFYKQLRRETYRAYWACGHRKEAGK